MRVRQRPGTAARVLAGLLPHAARLEVVMGPIPFEDFGWYLVSDADDRDLGFVEGWVAAGHEPDPFLVASGDRVEGSRFVAAFAESGDAEYGPVEIGEDGDYAIRWVAVDPQHSRCSFGVGLAAGAAEPVPAIRATIGSDLVPGTLQPGSFDALGVRGQVFVTVTSSCAWTFVIERVASPSPEPSPSA
jgi:hypothetical protein